MLKALIPILFVGGICLSAQELPDAPSKVALDRSASDQKQDTTTLEPYSPKRGVKVHRFFDKINIVLISSEVGALTADGIVTQNKRQKYGPGAQELDPIARPFVNAGWPGQMLGGSIVIGADVGLCYLMHRLGHHRIERVLPFILIGYGASGAIYTASSR